ncbi:zinc fingers and homeoboxes protein 1-like [Chiloscyllium plagiosum]|uniref:zinc fingers and homeoboxes protein 1-like n=1 Tax=Chiloscyllium plagiosum TaxID=36176 RepID=UPI001CB82EC7|nr:zinc fingers and homeoboxes protein 1-like [Chiloscyllium plagiosum]XP_043542223.1 zinc fingers and homeoboxes protein 1-like [Chiloscyllium plagiosum]
MASKRKSKIPCMVPASEILDQDPELDMITVDLPPDISDESLTADGAVIDDENLPEKEVQDIQIKRLEGGYECKYCTFETQDLNEFTLHVDSKHPNVILNPSYFCVECNFTTKRYDTLNDHNARYHSGEINFKLKMVKHNNQTVFEQTVEESSSSSGSANEDQAENTESTPTGISISKTPIMKMIKNKTETKRISLSSSLVDEFTADQENNETLGTNSVSGSTNTSRICINQETNGVILDSVGVSQVISSPATNFVPKVMIPVNSIPTYNTNMDVNTHLVNSFNKFPYPTPSEVATLKTQTKYAEEQIKIWFTAQRLKHGISWTPEEVDDAKKKLFNGRVHTIPQTITVIPAQISTSANGLQHILQPCQIVGQPGIVLAQVANTNAIAGNSPLTVSVAGVANQMPQWQKRRAQEGDTGPEAKRANNAQFPQIATQGGSLVSAPAMDPYGVRLKKTKEQLTELKASFNRNAFPSDAEIARIIQVTGLSRGDIKKWFSDTRYNHRNSRCNQNVNVPEVSSTIVLDSGDETTPESLVINQQRKHGRNAFPDFTPQKFKEKTVEQLHLLEESFLLNPFPTDDEVNKLRTDTKLTRREIDVWFCERRKAKSSEDKNEENGKAVGNEVDIKGKESEGVSAKSSYGQIHTTSLASGLAIPRVMAAAASRLYKKTPEQLHLLKSAFVRTQWPSPEEYDRLAAESGLARTDIVSWFGDTRYAWKNGNLKWYYYYQTGNVDSQNGQTQVYYKKYKGRGRSRGRSRGRGRLRGTGRANSWSGISTGKVSSSHASSGKNVLEQYYLKHKYLNEEDLDDLVARSSMSYESIREWFVQKQTESGASESNNSDGQYPGDDEKNEALEEDEDWPGEENASQEDEDDASDVSGSSDVWKPPSQKHNQVMEADDQFSIENSKI